MERLSSSLRASLTPLFEPMVLPEEKPESEYPWREPLRIPPTVAKSNYLEARRAMLEQWRSQVIAMSPDREPNESELGRLFDYINYKHSVDISFGFGQYAECYCGERDPGCTCCCPPFTVHTCPVCRHYFKVFTPYEPPETYKDAREELEMLLSLWFKKSFISELREYAGRFEVESRRTVTTIHKPFSFAKRSEILR